MRSTFYTWTQSRSAGFSFVELLVTAALVALVFGGLFAAVQSMIALISNSKAKAGAVALATERIEYIRSLSYDDIGTISGVPAGAIPQNRTVSLNSSRYDERVLVEYFDDPADGAGLADGNGILSDYKRVKVEYSWATRQGTSSIALSTTVVPPGVETTAGGGTLRVIVNDANVQPVANATVRFVNSTGTSTIDTIRFTDPSGMAQLGGAPALSGYEIYVSRAGYSSDGTAIATGTLSSPTQPVVSVAESSVTTQYFQIDRVSDLLITTAGVPTYGTFVDDLSDTSLIASSSNIVVGSGIATLQGVPGSYAAQGVLVATSTRPSPITEWYTLTFAASTSASTSVRVQLAQQVGTSTALIPDSDLPGNSSGFTTSPVDLTALDIATYDELQVVATLETVDPNHTPALTSWELTHVATEPVLSGIPMTVQGNKVLGTNAVGAPVYKNVFSDVTDASGEWSLSGIEYDAYTVSVDDLSYQVVEVCPGNNIAVLPNTSEVIDFTIAAAAGPQLRVSITSPDGTPIPGATVQLRNVGLSYSESQTTSLCGQTYFTGGGLATASDYEVTVTKPGYIQVDESSVVVSPTSTIAIQIN